MCKLFRHLSIGSLSLIFIYACSPLTQREEISFVQQHCAKAAGIDVPVQITPVRTINEALDEQKNRHMSVREITFQECISKHWPTDEYYE